MATLKSLVDETSSIKDELKACHSNLKNTLIEKGLDCSDNDKMIDLVEKVNETQYIKGYNNLPQWFKDDFIIDDYVFSCKNMTTARYGLTSSAVGNKIYVIGGYTSNHYSTNECYNPSTNTWSTVKSIITGRSSLTSSVVDNKIYVIGGTTGGTNYLTQNECYIP